MLILVASCVGTAESSPRDLPFTVPSRGEVVAKILVDCGDCDWKAAGREAVVFNITIDGRYVQHLVAVRNGKAYYDVLLGPLAAGSHTIRVEEDVQLTAHGLRGGRATVGTIAFETIRESSAQHTAVSFAPFIYARPNTVGRFTDVPVFMWYEVEPTARGTRYRYSVIFTNEDGGTPADRLMATWGRTTDIEYVYSVELDPRGAILSEDMQGPEHEILPFQGTREGRHPLLWVSTENNMVLDKGTTNVRYAPAPIAFSLNDVSREAVMDAHPWLYAVMAQELIREGKIVADAPPGKGVIPDPRRFVYVEGCGDLGGSALAFAVRLEGSPAWIASDHDLRDYRIARDGCFRAAIPLPAALSARDLRGLRAQSYLRPPKVGAPPTPAGPARLTRINKVFMLDERYAVGPSLFQWKGDITLIPDGPPVELPVK